MKPSPSIRTGISAGLNGSGVRGDALDLESDMPSEHEYKPGLRESVSTPLRTPARPPLDTNNCDQPLPKATLSQPFYSIPELAERWRCSRASVYNLLRGEKVVDFAAAGKKGHKVVPFDVVLKIERAHLRVLR